MTPTEIWDGFDPNKGDLEATTVSQDINENIICTKSFFTSEIINNEKIKVYSQLYSDKRWSDPRGVILVIPSIYNLDYSTIVNNFLKEGYAVFFVDYFGNSNNENHTKFPSSMSFCLGENFKDTFSKLTENARKTPWFNWAKIIRRSISFLETQSIVDKNSIFIVGLGAGAEIGWQVSAMDKRVKGFVSISGGGYIWSKNKPKFLYGNIPQNDEERAFSMGVGAETYARLITCPVLLISAIGSYSCDLDRMGDLYNLVQSDKKQLCFSHSIEPQISANIYNVFKKWLRTVMQGTNESIPKPTISFENIEGSLFIKTNIDPKYSISEVKVYVSYGEPSPLLRSWKNMERIQLIADNNYLCQIPLSNKNDLVVAYANYHLNDNYIVSTPIIGIKPADLKVTNEDVITKINPRIIYDATKGLGEFKAKTNEVILEKHTLSVKEGPFGIKGISSKKGDICLYRSSSDLKMLIQSSLLHIDIYSPAKRDLIISVLSIDGLQEYKTTINLVGGEFWQKITLDCQDFKQTTGKSLSSFTNIKAFTIVDAPGLVLTNFLWI